MDTKYISMFSQLRILALLGCYVAQVGDTDVSRQRIGSIFKGQHVQGDFDAWRWNRYAFSKRR